MSNHSINLNVAIEMTTLFRNERNNILQPSYQNLDILPICETFDKESIQKLIESEEVKSFRIYYGMSEDKKVHAILVGADESGTDILPSDLNLRTESTETEYNDNMLLEKGIRCPPDCPSPSPLNED